VEGPSRRRGHEATFAISPCVAPHPVKPKGVVYRLHGVAPLHNGRYIDASASRPACDIAPSCMRCCVPQPAAHSPSYDHFLRRHFLVQRVHGVVVDGIHSDL
jgi:hypothetical protein